MTYQGKTFESLQKLRGVQLALGPHPPRLSYRALTANGSVVACSPHLEELRKTETAKLTGESFPLECCDYCLIETGREERL